MDVSALVNNSNVQPGSKAAQKAQETQDRFLTLLVAQMKNQDPMNPMENAQLTTQIAQIQTVTGVDNLNTTVEKLSSQFSQGQTLQGVALVGHDVTLPGNRLAWKGDHAEGSLQLSGPADKITVEVTNSAGLVIDTVELGAAGAGTHEFNWSKAGFTPSSELNYRVKALRGNTPVAVTTQSRDTVVAVTHNGGRTEFQLASGNTASFDQILTID